MENITITLGTVKGGNEGFVGIYYMGEGGGGGASGKLADQEYREVHVLFCSGFHGKSVHSLPSIFIFIF